MYSQERNGKYRFFEKYRDPLTGKLCTVSVTMDRDTTQSRKKAAALLRQKIETRLGSAAAPTQITLGDLVERYARHQASAVKRSTLDRNSYEAAALLRILGEDSIVDRLTAPYVTERLLSADETVSCTNARIKFLKAMVRWGYKQDFLATPALADKVDYLPDRRKKEKLQDKYMEPEELRKLLDGMKVTRWRLLTQFLCLSGLRIGELIALDDSDVTDYIHVAKTYDLRTDTLSDTPKTDASNRDVYVQPELAECIREIRQERRRTELASGIRSPLFFPENDGGRMRYPSYNKYLKETSERILGRELTTHACRHTMTSIFAAQGTSLEAISRRLGHEDSEITRKIYLHVTAEQRKKDEEQFDRVKFFEKKLPSGYHISGKA